MELGRRNSRTASILQQAQNSPFAGGSNKLVGSWEVDVGNIWIKRKLWKCQEETVRRGRRWAIYLQQCRVSSKDFRKHAPRASNSRQLPFFRSNPQPARMNCRLNESAHSEQGLYHTPISTKKNPISRFPTNRKEEKDNGESRLKQCNNKQSSYCPNAEELEDSQEDCNAKSFKP